ncbi:creatininase family protein [Haloarcula argentinensis]|nr:creatininase family protein [Haloarcula argentinensis]
MHLETSSWTDIKDPAPTVALLPIGSTEQHGPHAPVGTDMIIAEELAKEADRRNDLDSVVLPTVPVGIAPYHSHFPGTLSVSAETLRQYVYDIVNSLSNSSVETVVLVNGHGGNGDTLRNLTRTVADDSMVDLEVFLWEWMNTVDDHVNHAGELETSMLLHICPGNLGKPTRGDAPTWDDTVDGGYISRFTEEFSKNGAVGDGTAASAEEGEQLFETATDALCSFLNRVI